MASGDFWVVKSDYVHVQGRYWSDRKDGQSSARAVAVGGPFLQGNRLIIEQGTGGKIYWNEREILFDGQTRFQADGLISAQVARNHRRVVKSRFGWGGRWNRNRMSDVVQTVDIDLPLDVTLRVNRLSYRMDFRITMKQLPGGQDGHCGNFNGDAIDDNTDSINARFGHQVSGEDLLFDKKEYEFVGCFGDLKSDRDFPMQVVGPMVRNNGQHVDIVGCSALCSGYRFFARQGHGECFCGDSYGRHGPALGCACDTAEIGHSRNCVYQLMDAAQTPQVHKLEDCRPELRQLAEEHCTQNFADDEHSMVFVGACVYDVCFGGAEFINTDGLAAETLG